MRIALGISYQGGAYQGWQSQPSGQTVQDQLEKALAQFAEAVARTSLPDWPVVRAESLAEDDDYAELEDLIP